MLSGSVGRGGVNVRKDVLLVQALLNGCLAQMPGKKSIAIDGIVGPITIAAIENYQKSCGLKIDGRVDRNGPTIRKLIGQTASQAQRAIDNARYGLRWKAAVAGEQRGNSPLILAETFLESIANKTA